MKFLIDMPISPSLTEWLQVQGYETIHVSRIGMATANDKEILKYAREEGSIIITADLDFPRLIAIAGDDSPPLILFRGGNYNETEMKSLLQRVLQVISPEDIKRSIVVVDKTRIRKIAIPIH